MFSKIEKFISNQWTFLGKFQHHIQRGAMYDAMAILKQLILIVCKSKII